MSRFPETDALTLKYKSNRTYHSTGYVPKESYDDTVKSRTYTNASVREPYRTGDGDTPVFIRPGALDFKDKPSRGQR